MAPLKALERYRRYLESVDQEAPNPSEDGEEYFELLSPGEAIDLLCARDEIEEAQLSVEEAREVKRLDALLLKHHRLVSGNVIPPPKKPDRLWWWFLSDAVAASH